MKKIVIFCITLSVAIAMLSACDSMNVINQDTSPYLQTSANRIPIDVQYIRTGYSNSNEYPAPAATIVVFSREHLLQYYEDNKVISFDGQGNVAPDKNFLSAIEKYSGNYFAGNFLVIIRLVESSGSIRHKVEKIDENGNIVIKRLVPEMGTADMAAWSILVELNRQYETGQYTPAIVDEKN